MKTYREWRGPNFASFNGDPWAGWLVVVSAHRDSGAVDRVNLQTAFNMMPQDAQDDWVESHSSHWAVGHIDVLLVRPGSKAAEVGAEIVERLEDYPVLDQDALSEEEQTEADEIWLGCYSVKERIAFIRDRRHTFEFRNLADMLGCVRGRYFAGYPDEVIR